jgi:hypothetical protein
MCTLGSNSCKQSSLLETPFRQIIREEEWLKQRVKNQQVQVRRSWPLTPSRYETKCASSQKKREKTANKTRILDPNQIHGMEVQSSSGQGYPVSPMRRP